MFALPLGLDAELRIISICAAHDANSLDLLHREGFDMLIRIADQAQTSNTTSVGESDVTPIGLQLPPALFVLHASVIVLKLGVAFLAGLVVAAILIEARDGGPGAIRTGLTSLRVKRAGKRVLFCQDSTIALEVVFVDASSVHPEADALIANELHHADRFIDSRILPLAAVEFVLVDEHPSCPPVCFLFS